MNDIIKRLKDRFDASDVVNQREDLSFITVKKSMTIPVITHMRDYEDFSHFVLLTAVDWIEDGEFQLTYLLHNHDKKIDIGIRTMISRDEAVMDSAHHLWEHVATYQRELKEMYGIDFPGSPRVAESFLLEGWTEIPPMRRDFDTKKYSEETYFPREGRTTKDPSEHMREKLYNDYPDSKK